MKGIGAMAFTMEKRDPLIDRVKKVYIYIFLIYLMLSRIVPFVNLITIRINGLVYNFLAIWGCIILAWDFILNLYEFRSVENIILLCFLMVCGISTILNAGYGYMDNIKTIVWTGIQFYILFSSMHISKVEDLQQSMNIIMKTTTFIWFVSTIISLGQFILQISYRMSFSEFDRRQGFVDSRLFGIYSDPNFAAITSLLVIIFSLFLFLHEYNRGVRFFYATSIVLQLLYVILSGSRTGMVEAAILAFIIPFLLIRNMLLKRWNRHYRLKSLTLALVISAIVLLIARYSTGPLIKLARIGEEFKAGVTGEETIDEGITLSREDVSEDNIGNNRFNIWKSAIQVSQNSRIFGVSPRNLVAYASSNYPDSYIAKTGYETHNGYLAVFVGTGITGTVVILCFILYILYNIFRYIIVRRGKTLNDYWIVCFGTSLTVAISALTLLDIFFVNTFSAAIFWLFTGYLLYLTKKGCIYE